MHGPDLPKRQMPRAQSAEVDCLRAILSANTLGSHNPVLRQVANLLGGNLRVSSRTLFLAPVSLARKSVHGKKRKRALNKSHPRRFFSKKRAPFCIEQKVGGVFSRFSAENRQYEYKE